VIQTYLILGMLIGVVTVLAQGSARRLIVAGAFGLIISFLLHPWATLTGAFSRHTITPTGIAFAGVMPWLWLAPILAVGVLVFIRARGRQISSQQISSQQTGLFGILIGAATLVLAAISWNQKQAIVTIGAVPGVLEALIPLGAFGLAFWLKNGLQKPWHRVVRAAAALFAVIFGNYLFSPSADGTFDALRGYYKIVNVPSSENLALVLKDWNQEDLKRENTERVRINNEWTALNVPNSATLTPEQSQELKDKIRSLIEQRAELGLRDGQALLEPLQTISSADEFPVNYKNGKASSDAGIRRIFPRRPGYGFGAWLLFGTLLCFGGITLLVRRDSFKANDLSGGAVLAVVVATLAFGFNAVEFDLGRLIKGWPWIVDFLDRAFPPDFQAVLSEVLKSMSITLATAMIGTLLAALLALPTSLLAARNLTRKTLLGRIAYVLMRVFYNVNRGIDTLIIALILVAAVGLGPFAAVVAMGIHSMSDLGKLYSEAIENADQGPIEALEAAGAPGLSVVRWALLPQVQPLFVSYTLYRFEINFRVSIILGFVGAGGIGFLIQETMRSGKYDQLSVAVIAVIVMVNILDFISASVRRRIIG
jgi:phosphonate transport system permease protein